MKSRIYARKKSTREQTPDFSTAPAQAMFQSRPFVVQTQMAEKSQQQPDLKTSLRQAERYGHHLSRMHQAGVSASNTTIQRLEMPQEKKRQIQLQPEHTYKFGSTVHTDALNDWRKTKTQEYAKVGEPKRQKQELERQKQEMPKLRERVEGITEGIEESRVKQFKQIQDNLRELIKEYDQLSDEDKIKNSDRQKGTEAYIRSRLNTLAERPIPEKQKDLKTEEWENFENLVHKGWEKFRNSNWDKKLRGVNNNREYKKPESVRERLANAKGQITIRSGVYKISNSLTAGVSLHRDIPKDVRSTGFESYIFHL